MLKTLGTTLLLACGLAINAAPAFAMQIVVTQVDKNANGSMTYHFAVKVWIRARPWRRMRRKTPPIS